MRTKDIIQPLTGTKNIVIKDIRSDAESNGIVITVRPTKKEQCRCSYCHRKAKYYDAGHGSRRWRTLDIGESKAFVEAPAPRVSCKEHGVVAAAVPWARRNSRFCKSFEEQVVELFIYCGFNSMRSYVLSIYLRMRSPAPQVLFKRVWELSQQAPRKVHL